MRGVLGAAGIIARLIIGKRGWHVTVIDWLLDSDPSIRWQVMRDLTHEPPDVVASERARIGTEGWGARLLALQAPDGLWAGNAFSQDGTDTFHVLELLRRLGLDPGSEQAHRALGLVRDAGDLGDGAWRNPPWAESRFFEGEVEPCINGNVVSTGAYFGVDMTAARRPAARRAAAATAAGTARSRTARRCRRSGPRSTSSRACSSTSGRSVVRTECGRPAAAARSTCSSAGCSAGSRPAR